MLLLAFASLLAITSVATDTRRRVIIGGCFFFLTPQPYSSANRASPEQQVNKTALNSLTCLHWVRPRRGVAEVGWGRGTPEAEVVAGGVATSPLARPLGRSASSNIHSRSAVVKKGIFLIVPVVYAGIFHPFLAPPS